MKRRESYLNFTGSSFMEYAIVIGIVSLLLIGMNIYIKRGVQAKVKDMTDYFITNKQEAEINPSTKTESVSYPRYDSAFVTTLSPGGGSGVTLSETAKVSAVSRTIDTDTPYTDTPFIPAPEGYIEPPVDEGTDSSETAPETAVSK